MNEDYTPKNKNGYLSGDGTPEEQEIAQARKKRLKASGFPSTIWRKSQRLSTKMKRSCLTGVCPETTLWTPF